MGARREVVEASVCEKIAEVVGIVAAIGEIREIIRGGPATNGSDSFRHRVSRA
jgi:hypothetical protein